MILANTLDDISFDYLRSRLALESVVTADTFGLFRNLLPKASELFKSYIPNLIGQRDTTEVKLDRKSYREALRLSKSFSFITYSDTLIQVPEGFSGKLDPYLRFLITTNEILFKEGLQVVTDYVTELSLFLSHIDSRTTLKSKGTVYKGLKSQRETYERSIKTFFQQKNATQSRVPLSNVMSRFQDLESIFTQAERLEQLQRGINLKALQTEITKASDLLGLIKQRCETDDIKDLSTIAAQNIAEGAYEVAKYVELLAMMSYYTDTALGSIKNLSEQLNHIFGR